MVVLKLMQVVSTSSAAKPLGPFMPSQQVTHIHIALNRFCMKAKALTVASVNHAIGTKNHNLTYK